MFGWDQRQRLLRESWTANALAEEIFAMMSPDAPNDTNAPVKINTEPGVPPFELGNFNNGDTIFNIKHPDGSQGPIIGFDGGNWTVDKKPIIGASGGGGGGGSVVPVWG